MKLEPFNEDYLRRLADGDAATSDHFASYFSKLLDLKLRARLRCRDLIDDVVQDTLLRVLIIVREGQGVERPERFGAFVNSVCNHVFFEMLRAVGRYERFDEFVEEPLDPNVDPNADLITAEKRQAIERVLAQLPIRDASILRAIYLEEVSKADVCRRFGVDNGYLRVLLHRAKEQFRKACGKDGEFAFNPGKS